MPVSHDLYKPLPVLRARLESALRSSGNMPSKARPGLEQLVGEVQCLTRMGEALVLLTRSEAGVDQPEVEALPLGEVVREALAGSIAWGQSHGVSVKLVESDPVVVRADRQRMRQLLRILVENGRNGPRLGDSVSIAARQVEGQAQIQITSRSEGLVVPSWGCCFAPRVLAEAAPSQEPDLCCMCLELAQWMAQSQGGSIRIECQPGQATLVTVRLPRASAGPPNSDSEPS